MPTDRCPHDTQLDSMDCGPTCLRMIARYYGRRYSLETLRDKAFITREGVSMGLCQNKSSKTFFTKSWNKFQTASYSALFACQ